MGGMPAMTFESYDELGCVAPIRVMAPSEAATFLARLDAVTETQVDRVAGSMNVIRLSKFFESLEEESAGLATL